MGDIKKIATQDDIMNLQETLLEAINNSVTANGVYNSTVRTCVAEIYEAVVTKDAQA